MMATLEHTNFTVRDPQASAAWMHKVFHDVGDGRTKHRDCSTLSR